MASEKESSKFQSTDFEEEVKELLKSMRTCIDQEEHAKWILEGEKYEEHEEVLMQQQKNEPFNCVGHAGKYIYFMFELTYMLVNELIFFLGTRHNNTFGQRKFSYGKYFKTNSGRSTEKTRKKSDRATPPKKPGPQTVT
jgi:hypothetical protein